ncbi:MAG TPA: carboxypeptidase-like regulatory domain-containing protein [Pirellulaceae bacterium]|nr:carboxypeptidase-like regulatory domain-containing protein [Pirellulaceae bacterium]
MPSSSYKRRLALALMLVLLAASSSGCGGSANVAPVKGRVTLDGSPLENALVQFSPGGVGAPSSGRTNAQGEYELTYTEDVKGAVIGNHVVRVTTYQSGDPDADPPRPEVAERVPEKYAAGIPKEVKPGANVINIEL